MDKPNTENVMALAFELAETRQRFGPQHPDYRAQVIALRTEVERLAAQAARDDAALYQTIGERDNYHKWADKLADGIATHLGIDIGEHTAGMGSAESNNPWANALEAIQSADPPACPNCRGSGCVQQMTGHLGPDDYEETVDCPHCNGNQTLEAAYLGVVKSLKDEREAHMRTRGIIWGWSSSRSEVNAVQHKMGNILEHLKPGNIAWVGDRLRDLIASAAAQPSQAPVVQATSEPQTWHDLKADPDAWDAVAAGIKTHEIRLDDRDFAVGDGLRLRKTRYTGHEMRTLGKPLEYIDQPIERIVSHIQRGYGLDPGWCILSFADRASSGATTAQAVRMLTPDEPEKCYSLDEETFYDLGDLIDMLDEEQAKPGFLIYEGESVRHTASHYARGAVADLFERMGEQAFDDAGEHIGDWPDHAVKDDNSAELEKLIYDWLDANVKVHFYTVKNVRQIALTADMLGDDDTGRTIPASGEIGSV